MQLNAQLRINEVMQSNVHVIMDDLNEYPDSWVELYNESTSKLNLADYSISVDTKAKKAYRLPEQELLPGQFVVIYCDKEGKGLHTSFRVDSGKGDVYLWHGGEIIETVSLKKMPAPDIAWGRASEASEEWGYQVSPTPGTANLGLIKGGLLGDVVFSQAGGICTSPVKLSLSLPEDAPAGTKIFYTTDGSVPTKASNIYTAPINIAETTIIRATAMASGICLSPLPTTASFIFHGREQTLPIVSLTTDAKNFYDDKIGILVKGSYSSDKENFQYDWRRPVNIEYFEKNGTRVLSQVGETRLKGASSRTLPLKSMVIYANKRFGEKRFNHEFFPEQKPGLNKFKSLELRNSGQDFHSLYMRDALCQRVVGENADVDWQAWQPAIVYLNGEYMGVLNVRERSNEDNVEANYDGLEDITMIENWWELGEGDMTQFTEFRAFYNQTNHTLEEYEARMDVNEFLTYMFAEAYFCNTDFPSNNLVLWRPMADGGKWRWILKDLDICLGFNPQRWDLEYFSWLYDPDFAPDLLHGNGKSATQLFRSLMDVDGVKEHFIDMGAVYLGDFLNIGRFIALMDKMRGEFAEELPYHHARWDVTWINYDERYDYVKNWMANRHDFFYDHLAAFAGYEKPVRLVVDSGDSKLPAVINGTPLTFSKFDGKWFPGRKLCVSIEASEGKVVGGWRVTLTNAEGEETYVQPGETFDMVFPYVESMELEPILGPVSIDEVGVDGEPVTVEYYDMQGRCLGSRKPSGGIFLRKAGTRVTKVRL